MAERTVSLNAERTPQRERSVAVPGTRRLIVKTAMIMGFPVQR